MSVKSEEEIKRIIQHCVKGKRRAQEELYKMFYGKMMGVCRRYAHDDGMAKDMLQEGFIKVFAKLEKYNFQGSFEGWVRRIIANNAIDVLRKNKKLTALDNEEQLPEEDESFAYELEEVDEDELKVADIIDAMQLLTPAYRAVMNLYIVENYSHKEIAEILGISVGTSKSNLAKGKQNLRKILTSKMNLSHG